MINVSKLNSYVDLFQGTKVTVLGDIIVDEYTWGSVDRVSPEAPIVVVQVTNESFRLGGAANVANNLARLGAEVTLCGVVGGDETGKICVEMLASEGIDPMGIIVDNSRPTTKKTRIIAHSQQVVRVDREVSDDISQANSEDLYNSYEKLVLQSKASIVSDYGKGVITKDLKNYLMRMREAGQIGWKKCPVIVDPKGIDYSRYHGATCVKPNKKEASQVTGIKIKTRKDAIEVAEGVRVKGDFEMAMVTLGEMGLVLVRDGAQPYELDTIAQEIFDVSGAGDTVSAVFTLSLAVGASPEEAATLANCAAARVIREVGTATLDPDELKEVVEFWGQQE